MYNTHLYVILQYFLMSQEAKLVIADKINGEKQQFLILTNQVVGKGSFGTVRKAVRKTKPNQILVAKQITYQNQNQRQTIEKQLNIIRRLPNNRNLVRVQPIKCFSENNFYIFMEYCPDGTLDLLMKNKKGLFTETQIFDIFYQVMSGYKVLWDAKILHQDLKLQNILIKNGLYKITDFGFSMFYEGVKHSSIRLGTLSYMPIQMLTQKQYFASTKSDVYSMGVIFFKLITGHHPYVIKSPLQLTNFIAQFQKNQLYLKPNFSNKFSIKFQHFFDLILKMVAKNQKARIDFDEIYEYMQNEQIFQQLRKNANNIKSQIQDFSGKNFVVTGYSEAIGIGFEVPQDQQKNYQKQIKQKLINKKIEQKQTILKQLQNYIISNRIMVYYFDRLTRRIYIQKTKRNNVPSKQNATVDQVILGLLLLCKKIVQNLLKQSRSASKYPMENWRAFRRNNQNILRMIERDENYLQDLIIDNLTENSGSKSSERKQIIDKSKADFDTFKKYMNEKLNKLFEQRSSGINVNDRNSLITLCYINCGIEILCNFDQMLENAMSLESYFRIIQTEDTQILFHKVVNNYMHKKIDFAIDLGEEIL